MTITDTKPSDPDDPNDPESAFDGWIKPKYTDEELLNSMRDAAVDGLLTMSMYNNSPHRIVSASQIQRRFGSWSKPCKMIHLRDGRQDLGLSDDQLLENVRQVWIHKGDQPILADMSKSVTHTSVTGSKYRSLFSGSGYTMRFGSWANLQIRFKDWFLTNFPGDVLPTGREVAKATRRKPSRAQRTEILERDGYTCQAPGCGLSTQTHPHLSLHVDHILPISNGGTNHPSNLQTLCAQHNLEKGRKMPDADS